MFRVARRHAAFVLLVVLIIPMLAACGGGAATEPTPTATAQEEPTAVAGAPTEAPTETPTRPAATPTTAATATPGDTTGDVKLPEVDPATVSGDIIIAGSSTVFPLTEAVADIFREEGYTGQISIAEIGTGAGFERFCVAAETDIANASRPIKDTERQACIDNKREPIEFRVGTDALAVVVHPDNDWVDDVTLEELAMLFSDDGAPRLWSDVNPDWPSEPVIRYSPGTDSGTFDYFIEEVFEKNTEPLLTSDNVQLSEDDNVLVQGVLGDRYSIGYFGYAYYTENPGLKILSIEGVEPTEQTAEDFSYPLARPLFIYSAQPIMQEKPQVAAFINYYLTNVNEVIQDVGYFPASARALNTARQNWLDAMGM
jgi:phosphate-binding protein